jgi:3-hydroxyacyl-CoA dehydrogenase / enoyl-CoA hydratase / 3-hydroxybutyryl-CoA epimerase
MLYESQHFRLEADDGVLTLWLDFRGRPSHTLTLPILHELNLVLDRVAVLPAPEILLLRSGRPGLFLEEFDSAEVSRFKSPLEFAALSRRGQEAGRKIAALRFPTTALIEGRCSGAGFELALACNYRWVVASPESRFVFPEVDRGLLPCWGGTVRLPRLVGVTRAVRLFSGDSIGPVAALRAGVVDELIRPAEFQVRLLTLVDRLRDRAGGRGMGMGRSVWRALGRFLSPALSFALSRPVPSLGEEPDLPRELRHAVAMGRRSEGEGFAAERAAFTRLATTEGARRRLELDRCASRPVRVYPEPANPIPLRPRRIAIVGGGNLGSRLACRFSRFGHEVIIQEENLAGADRASRLLADRYAEAASRGEIDAEESRRMLQGVRVTTGWVGVENADLVVEAVTEDSGVKRNVIVELERRLRPRTPLLTTATTIPVETLQAESARPGRILGLHFPNPDAERPIAELVGSGLTGSDTLATIGQWARYWGFVPVRVADRPGRLVDLVRLTYLSEGVGLVAEGLPIIAIDAGCRRFGMDRGPLEWCDQIGFDRLAERVAQLQLARGDGFARNLLFQRLLPVGCLGREVGEGFYRYGLLRRPSETVRMVLWQDLDEDARAPYTFDPADAVREGIERIVLRTVNESAGALTEEPDSDPTMVDVALAFGMGWAPSRGGPLRYADAIGLPTVVERLSSFAERFGTRYTPCDELVRRADAGEMFYVGSSTEGVTSELAWRIAG